MQASGFRCRHEWQPLEKTIRFLITRPIRNPEISRTIGVVRSRGGTLSPAAERFLKMLIGVWGSD